ncbi:MAG TPA: dephospho-CoA kinase [Lysobacter sp.]|nr:dephospho-CoA kinase [Lysobacter sp.]
MSEPYVIGVTGGIASGKSEVTRRFEALGIEIVDADVIAREVVEPGSDGLAALVARFGAGVLQPDGRLDRAALRRHVFERPDERRALEAIVHPRVRTTVEARCRAARGPYVIAAVPLLAEGGGRDAYPYFSRILVVDVPVEVQRARLVARDAIDPPLADSMIAAQATRAQRLAIADDVVVNAGSRESLASVIDALDRRYRQFAGLAAA